MIYQSENFTLDTQSYGLARNGQKKTIEPQVFDLLIYLIENRNRVVTRNELLDSLWNGRIVSDSALNARLKLARKAIGDDGKTQAVIKTIHRRGYQFVGLVSEAGLQDNPASDISIISHSSPALKETPSIAVLEFSNLSEDPGQRYFSEGMSITLSARLSRIRALRIVSCINLDGDGKSPTKIAAELEVGYLLSGSVQREGDHVRVTVELINGASGEILWSERFDRRGSKVMDIQDEIANAITGTLWSYHGTIVDAERDKAFKKVTENFNAFDYVLKGMAEKELYTAEELKNAHECFEKAIELDPDCAEAYSYNSCAYVTGILMGLSDDIAHSLQQAFSNARRAIEIDPFYEGGYWTLAEAYIMSGEYERGFAEFDKALEISPYNPDILATKGCELAIYGRCEEGIELILQALDFNKHPAEWYHWDLGIAYFCAEKMEQAIESLNRMNQQNQDSLGYLAAAYAHIGDFTEAHKRVVELLQIAPDTSLEEVARTHAHMSDKPRNMLIDGLGIAMGDTILQEKLRVI